MRWDGGDEGYVGGDDVDDEPDGSQRGDDGDGDDFLDRYLPAGELSSLCLVSAPRRRRKNNLISSPIFLGKRGILR